MIGYDYTARIAPAALKAAGCAVAFRYVMPQTPFWVKALRNAEAQELLAAGIPIVSNFESTANREDGGAQAGHDDAVTLLADWKALGAPSGLIGWFSADWDVQPSEVPAVLAYLNAAASVLGGKQYVGCYGGLRAVSAAMDAGFGGWQTVAWSGGRWDPRAVARQTGRQLIVGGVQVDENVILNLAGLGAWGGPTTPTPTSEGIDMTPDESKMLAEIHTSAVDYANWQFFMPPGREQVQGTHAWRMQSTLDNTVAISTKLDQLLAKVGQPPAVDVKALAAAIAPLLGSPAGGPSADSIAQAVVAHLGLQVVAK